MINNVILTGHFKGFSNDNKILLKLDKLVNHQTVKINIANDLKEKIKKFIKDDDIVGIKGYIELDDNNSIIIVATKITFLSSSFFSTLPPGNSHFPINELSPVKRFVINNLLSFFISAATTLIILITNST